MILADKIMMLRKKNGWSQEELAERMNVSRQAVSKWEGAQTIPDLAKILQMGELFGVSMDYLLKDEIGEMEYAASTAEAVVEGGAVLRRVSMEEACEFLAIKEQTAKWIALATFLCILSPVCLLLLGAACETGALAISEGLAAGAGLITLLLMVAAAVAIFLFCGSKTEMYQFLEKEAFETEYGVDGMVRERQRQYRSTYTKCNVAGTCLCILSAVPLFVSVSLTENELGLTVGLCVLLLLVGIGVTFFVRAGVPWESMQKLLEEGDYTRQKKARSPFLGVISTVYWLLTTAIYLGWSFVTMDWEHTWIVWPVAGVLFGAVAAVCGMLPEKKSGKC